MVSASAIAPKMTDDQGASWCIYMLITTVNGYIIPPKIMHYSLIRMVPTSPPQITHMYRTKTRCIIIASTGKISGIVWSLERIIVIDRAKQTPWGNYDG